MGSKKSVKAKLKEFSITIVQNQRLSNFTLSFAIAETSFSTPTPILLRYNGHVTLYTSLFYKTNFSKISSVFEVYSPLLSHV